jgi:hypothetical protein
VQLEVRAGAALVVADLGMAGRGVEVHGGLTPVAGTQRLADA